MVYTEEFGLKGLLPAIKAELPILLDHGRLHSLLSISPLYHRLPPLVLHNFPSTSLLGSYSPPEVLMLSLLLRSGALAGGKIYTCHALHSPGKGQLLVWNSANPLGKEKIDGSLDERRVPNAKGLGC